MVSMYFLLVLTSFKQLNRVIHSIHKALVEICIALTFQEVFGYNKNTKYILKLIGLIMTLKTTRGSPAPRCVIVPALNRRSVLQLEFVGHKTSSTQSLKRRSKITNETTIRGSQGQVAAQGNVFVFEMWLNNKATHDLRQHSHSHYHCLCIIIWKICVIASGSGPLTECKPVCWYRYANQFRLHNISTGAYRCSCSAL